VSLNGLQIILMSFAPILSPTNKHSSGITTLFQQPFVQHWNLQIHITAKLSQLWQELAEGKGFVVSNGSFQDFVEAVAWIIKGATSTNCIQGSYLTPGAPEDHSAFRSKLMALFGILFTLSYFIPESSQEVSIMMACYGKKSALQ